jgi:hypothetical protein
MIIVTRISIPQRISKGEIKKSVCEQIGMILEKNLGIER